LEADFYNGNSGYKGTNLGNLIVKEFVARYEDFKERTPA
jgi:hypothetical protein